MTKKSEAERRESCDDLLVEIKVEMATCVEQLKSLNREITENVKPSIEKIVKYNKEQNGAIAVAVKECASNRTRSTMNTKLVIFAISLASGLGIYALTNFIH